MFGEITIVQVIGASGVVFGFGVMIFLWLWNRRADYLNKRDAERAESKKKQEEERREKEREEKKGEPILIGDRELPDGHLGIGFLWGYDKEAERPTVQLKTVPYKQRATHLYVVGASGMGKTKFLETLIFQDMVNGHGIGVIDPHGDLVEVVRGLFYGHSTVPAAPEEIEKFKNIISRGVVVIDPSDATHTVTFNPLEPIEGISSAEIAGELVSVFHKLWADSWGPRLEDLLRHSFIALCEAGRAFTDLPRFLSEQAFRSKILAGVHNPLCLQRFEQFDDISNAAQNTWVEPVRNKINALLTDERLWHLFSAARGTVNFREIMDTRKTLLVNLNKGKMKDGASLLGGLILAKIQMTALSRSDTPEDKRVPFYLYIDEFQNFATDSFLDTLSESRKFGLSLTLAHQNVSQLTDRLQDAILGNCGLHAYFRVSHKDANILAKELGREPFSDRQRMFFKLIKRLDPYGPEPTEQIQRDFGEAVALPLMDATEKSAYLQRLAERNFVFKNKITGEVQPLLSDNALNPWEAFPDHAKAKIEARAIVGSHYLRPRDSFAVARKEAGESGTAQEPETFREAKPKSDF